MWYFTTWTNNINIAIQAMVTGALRYVWEMVDYGWMTSGWHLTDIWLPNCIHIADIRSTSGLSMPLYVVDIRLRNGWSVDDMWIVLIKCKIIFNIQLIFVTNIFMIKSLTMLVELTYNFSVLLCISNLLTDQKGLYFVFWFIWLGVEWSFLRWWLRVKRRGYMFIWILVYNHSKKKTWLST